MTYFFNNVTVLTTLISWFGDVDMGS